MFSHALSAKAWLNLNPALAQLKRHRLLLPSLVCKDGSQNEADVPTEGCNELKPLMWSASKWLGIKVRPSCGFLCLQLTARGNGEKSQAEPFSNILFVSHLVQYSRKRNHMEFPSFEEKIRASVGSALCARVFALRPVVVPSAGHELTDAVNLLIPLLTPHGLIAKLQCDVAGLRGKKQKLALKSWKFSVPILRRQLYLFS